MNWVSAHLIKVATPSRLRYYPIVVLTAMWAVLLAHVAFRTGWIGLLGQRIAPDFVTFYAASLMYTTGNRGLYDFDEQARVQQAVIYPTPLGGASPFITPPYVAWAFSPVTLVSPGLGIILWWAFALACTFGACWLTVRWLTSPWLARAGLTPMRLTILAFSWYPFGEGILAGQTHALTLFLTVLTSAATLSGRYVLAGSVAGLSLYKPQFVLGFIILWLAWGKYRAVLSLSLVAAALAAVVVIPRGLEPFVAYASILDQIEVLPYVTGFPVYGLVTPYGFLASLLSFDAFSFVRVFSTMIALVAAIVVWKTARHPALRRRAVALAITWPLVATPYALLHDLLVLVPAFILCCDGPADAEYLAVPTIAAYFGAFVLLIVGQRTGVALPALIPVLLFIAWSLRQHHQPSRIVALDAQH